MPWRRWSRGGWRGPSGARMGTGTGLAPTSTPTPMSAASWSHPHPLVWRSVSFWVPHARGGWVCHPRVLDGGGTLPVGDLGKGCLPCPHPQAPVSRRAPHPERPQVIPGDVPAPCRGPAAPALGHLLPRGGLRLPEEGEASGVGAQGRGCCSPQGTQRMPGAPAWCRAMGTFSGVWWGLCGGGDGRSRSQWRRCGSAAPGASPRPSSMWWSSPSACTASWTSARMTRSSSSKRVRGHLVLSSPSPGPPRPPGPQPHSPCCPHLPSPSVPRQWDALVPSGR